MTQHHPENYSAPTRPASTDRCLRHHVWMAACGDCREAHAPLITGGLRRTARTR